jgi:hypothetical protein
VPLLLAGQRLAAALERLLAPAVVERLQDPMLAADLFHRAVAAATSWSSIFCCAVQFQYLRYSTNLIFLSVERPMLS